MQDLDGRNTRSCALTARVALPTSRFCLIGIFCVALMIPGCSSNEPDLGASPDPSGAGTLNDSSVAGVAPRTSGGGSELPTLRSVALRVHHTEAMLAFYREAFGVTFRDVDTFGINSHFGTLSGITLKLVPIRKNDDFVGFPDVQLGLEVRDLKEVLRIAELHGGRQEGELRTEEGLLHGAVRDPDGNTLELYQTLDPS